MCNVLYAGNFLMPLFYFGPGYLWLNMKSGKLNRNSFIINLECKVQTLVCLANLKQSENFSSEVW